MRRITSARAALLLSAIPVAFMAMSARAQSASTGTAIEDNEPQGEIVVTGSRLRQEPNAIAASPIQTVTIETLRSTGQTDITEVLREIPALISSGTAADSIERGAGGIGQATLNLRGLGANRTLVLVNGRRHIAGVAGTQTVDTATIPRALIQSVDILTGGASSIYGSDAVTGVVNFILKDKYEGLELNGQNGISSKGDGGTIALDAVWGKNFLDNRLNVTIAGSYSNSQELKNGDRDFMRGNAQATAGLTYQNPVRRFQTGDISAAATPNFADFFSTARNRYPYGFAIPLPGTAAYNAIYTGGRTPTAGEQVLIDRARSATSSVLGRFPAFAISSASGLIGRADGGGFTADVNRNGTADCLESYIGFRYASTGGGAGGGCYVSTVGGGIRPFRDGTISTNSNQLGGDGVAEGFDFVSVIPEQQRYDINLLTNYEVSDAVTLFTELKYVRTETYSQPSAPNSFYDSLYVGLDNPFLPAVLRPDAVAGGGLVVSRDFADIPNVSQSDRDTYRAVLGVRGDLTPHLNYQFYGNYGRTDNKGVSRYTVLPDRFFAAIDVVQGPNGPTCASNLDPTREHPGSQFFPVIGPGAFTFTPGANSGCVPINLFNGEQAVSPAALNWITVPTTTRSRIEQYVAAVEFTGDTGAFFNLPGGAVQFAAGAEYRKEKSRTRFDPLVLGILPASSPAGPAGTFVGNVDARQSLTFDGSARTLNTGGSFDVKEVFGEVRVPIVKERPFFHELSLNGAARYSDYSTIGGAFTWNVNGIYAPIRDFRVRGTYSVAIRAPNISELFSPQQGAFFRPLDPCDVTNIAALAASSDPANQARAARRTTNCTAAGAPGGYTDPLSARFSGTSGGNPNLTEERAKTWTAGGVLTPRFLPGLVISADYYSIRIDDGIASVSAQNIVNSCYESETFPNQYCDLITRRPDFGFQSLRQTSLNFGRLETSGIDASIAYALNLGEHRVSLRATGNWTEKLNQFFDPLNPGVVDPERGENGFPEWAATGGVNWKYHGVSLGYNLQYISKQALAGVEIERQAVEFGPAGTGPEYFIHDLSIGFDVSDRFSLYGGINNLTDEQPFINRVAYPVSPVGRFLFLGARARF
jgi:outer membrane receptor protein involved in Fe transport